MSHHLHQHQESKPEKDGALFLGDGAFIDRDAMSSSVSAIRAGEWLLKSLATGVTDAPLFLACPRTPTMTMKPFRFRKKNLVFFLPLFLTKCLPSRLERAKYDSLSTSALEALFRKEGFGKREINFPNG